MNDWHIQSRSHTCKNCEADFEDGKSYHTLLFEILEGYERMDICPKCWRTQFTEGGKDRKGFISNWQGTYQAPPPPEKEAIQKNNAETLLVEIVAAQDDALKPVAYILSAMLERKRILKVKERLKKDGVTLFIYEYPATGDIFTIEDPNLQLDQLEAVQEQVATLLETGLQKESPEAAPEEDPSNSEAEANDIEQEQDTEFEEETSHSEAQSAEVEQELETDAEQEPEQIAEESN
jgi:hypothetical protein